jgi:hypothetical protein
MIADVTTPYKNTIDTQRVPMNVAKLCTALLFLSPLTAYPEETPVAKLLLSSANDNEVKVQEQRTGFLKKGAYSGIPFIDDLELRFRNSAYDIDRIRYTVRVQPRGVGETFAANRYAKSIAQSSRLKLLVRKNAVLKDRYLLAIELFEQSAINRSLAELSDIYTDKINVLEQKVNSMNFGLNELIQAEDDYTKVRTQILDVNKAIAVLRQKIGFYLNDTGFTMLDTAGLVVIDSVIAAVERGSFSLDTENVYLEYFRQQIDLAKNRFDLEKAEGRKYISFIGFSYDNGDWLDEYAKRNDPGKSPDYNNAYMLELGIKIPDLTMARHDILRRKIDYLSEQDDYDELKRELGEKIKKDHEDLRSFIAQYRFLMARENEVDAASSLKKYLQMEGVDPLVLLSIKERIVKNHIDMSKLTFNILQNYIQVIDVSGELSKPPLRNFLSQKRGLLEP